MMFVTRSGTLWQNQNVIYIFLFATIHISLSSNLFMLHFRNMFSIFTRGLHAATWRQCIRDFKRRVLRSHSWKREKVTEHKRYNKTECETSVAKQMPFTKAWKKLLYALKQDNLRGRLCTLWCCDEQSLTYLQKNRFNYNRLWSNWSGFIEGNVVLSESNTKHVTNLTLTLHRGVAEPQAEIGLSVFCV